MAVDMGGAAASRATATNPKDLREILGVIVNASGRSTMAMSSRLTMNRRSSVATASAAEDATMSAQLQAAPGYRLISAPLSLSCL